MTHKLFFKVSIFLLLLKDLRGAITPQGGNLELQDMTFFPPIIILSATSISSGAFFSDSFPTVF